MGDRERNRCDLQKKIEQALKRNGEESHFRHALEHHLEVLKYSRPEEEIESRMEMCQYLFSKMFLDKMDLYPNQPFQCKLTENSDWPLMPVPSEFFGEEKQADEDRRMWFYASLNLGDVLHCRVSSALPNSFQLRVLHKFGVAKLLDDLQLMVVLCCAKNEIKVLEQKPLLVSELVRVAIVNIDKADEQIKISVTVDKDTVDAAVRSFKTLPKLGRISKYDLPAYVLEPPDTERFSSYSDYLNSKPQFQNPHFYDKLLAECGVDPKIVCSYFPDYNRKEHPEEQTGQVLLKESKLVDVKALANSALKELSNKQYNESLKLIEDALKICPSDDPLMSKLYDIRSDIYSAQSKSPSNYKALCDLELAFKLTPGSADIKQKFLHKIFKVANAHYRSKQYKKAVLGFEIILKYDENHRLAAKALDHIKTKHAGQLIDFEEKSLIDLQEKKLELISELKKIA